MEQPKKLSPAIAAIIVIVLVGIAATAVIVIHNNQQTEPVETTSPTTTTTDTPIESTSDEVADVTYKDGTYSATGSYQSPGGTNTVSLTVTLVNGVITTTSLNQTAESGESRQYQAAFASGYKSQVIGKKVDKVSLSRVAGSSLTSNGFNDALDQIKSDAAA